MPLCYQKILPATTSRHLEHPRCSEKSRQEEPKSGRRKSKAVKIACQMCKRRKVKCDGQRPECAPCAGRKDICRYDFDAAENTTRYQALNKKHRDLEQMLRHHLKLLDLLRQQPYDEAIAILGHIRKSATVSEILNLVAAGEGLLKVSTDPTIDASRKA